MASGVGFVQWGKCRNNGTPHGRPCFVEPNELRAGALEALNRRRPGWRPRGVRLLAPGLGVDDDDADGAEKPDTAHHLRSLAQRA
jgi:hypothetical protein